MFPRPCELRQSDAKSHGLAWVTDHTDHQADVEEDSGTGDRRTYEHDPGAASSARERPPSSTTADDNEPINANAHGVPHGEERRQSPHELDELAPATQSV